MPPLPATNHYVYDTIGTGIEAGNMFKDLNGGHFLLAISIFGVGVLVGFLLNVGANVSKAQTPKATLPHSLSGSPTHNG